MAPKIYTDHEERLAEIAMTLKTDDPRLRKIFDALAPIIINEKTDE